MEQDLITAAYHLQKVKLSKKLKLKQAGAWGVKLSEIKDGRILSQQKQRNARKFRNRG